MRIFAIDFADAESVSVCKLVYSANIILSIPFEDVTFVKINEMCEMRLNILCKDEEVSNTNDTIIILVKNNTCMCVTIYVQIISNILFIMIM